MILDKICQSLDQSFGSTVAVNYANVLQMAGHSIGDLSECVHIVVAKLRPRLVINHAIGSENEAGGTIQRYLRVESHIWPCSNVWAIFENLLPLEISDNVAGTIGGDVVAVGGMGHIPPCEQANRMRADPPNKVQTSGTEIDSIVG
jgi:hypothetical protein